MPPTRIGHKKSRFGCVRCKQRHVKCDEQRPCSNCVRHQAECSLVLSSLSPGASPDFPRPAGAQPDPSRSQPIQSTSEAGNQSPHSFAALPTPSTHSQHSNPLSPNPRASSIKAKVSSIRQALLDLTNEVEVLEQSHSGINSPQLVQENSAGPPSDSISTADWLGDMELFSHYKSSDCLGLSEYRRRELWHDVIPELAFTRESLMHGLLALSALHLAYLHPDRKREYAAKSARHQDVALSRLRNGLYEITEQNCFEHFLLAYLVILLTFSSIGNPLDDDDNDNTASPDQATPRRYAPLDIQELAQSLFLGQGIINMISSPETWTWMKRGPIGGFFQVSHPTPTPSNLGTDRAGTFAHRIARLHDDVVCQMGGSPGDAKVRASCLIACDGLRRAYGAVLLNGLGRREATPVWLWLTLLPPDFREHVARAHPVALLVLAHYAALVRCFEDRWYLAGWSGRVFAAVDDALEKRRDEEESGGQWWRAWLEFPRNWGPEQLDEAIRESEERGDHLRDVWER